MTEPPWVTRQIATARTIAAYKAGIAEATALYAPTMVIDRPLCDLIFGEPDGPGEAGEANAPLRENLQRVVDSAADATVRAAGHTPRCLTAADEDLLDIPAFLRKPQVPNG